MENIEKLKNKVKELNNIIYNMEQEKFLTKVECVKFKNNNNGDVINLLRILDKELKNKLEIRNLYSCKLKTKNFLVSFNYCNRKNKILFTFEKGYFSHCEYIDITTIIKRFKTLRFELYYNIEYKEISLNINIK